MTLSERLRKKGATSPSLPPKTPLWKGPEVDGVTFSLLSRFLVCKERFRLLVIEGLTPKDRFNHRIEYGQMWHICEEATAQGRNFKSDLFSYCRRLIDRYPMSGEDITKWYEVCCVQFPLYLQYWAKHGDVKNRVNLLAECAFSVPYKLPSGRTVILRGKWDSVDVVGRGKGSGIYLQENKTKGEVNEQQILRQLTFDLQTMLYMIALKEEQKRQTTYEENAPWTTVHGQQYIRGVIYNVVRRPLSGGKGTIKQKGGETKKEYYERLAHYITNEPHTYFMRWKVEISKEDIDRFKQQCFDPILDNLCVWWDSVDPTRYIPQVNMRPEAIHWRHPYGVFNVLDEGGSSELDEYLATGSTAGLSRATTLFPELE